MTRPTEVSNPHSGAWVIQAWLSFVLSVGVTFLGIWHLPVRDQCNCFHQRQ